MVSTPPTVLSAENLSALPVTSNLQLNCFVEALLIYPHQGKESQRFGVVNIENRTVQPHDPGLFQVNCLPFDYGAAAPTYPPLWQSFLRQLWPGDEDGKRARLTLQEMFGLMLTADTRYQKIFMIVGPKRSGKGTIARVLTRMLGPDNVANPPSPA